MDPLQKKKKIQEKLSLVRMVEAAPVNTVYFWLLQEVLSSLLDLRGLCFPVFYLSAYCFFSSTYSCWKASFTTVLLAKNKKFLWNISIQKHCDKTRVENCSKSKSSH